MKVSDYIAMKLADAGIDTAFLVQGAANNDLIYSIADRTKLYGDIRYVCPMHEQAAGFMAEGWAKVKGKPGLAIGTSGPGGQNLLTPICNFFYDSVPGIFITGQVNSQFMRPNKKIRQVGFQEWPACDAFAPVTKWSVELTDKSLVRMVIERALWLCQDGRPGPVHIDIPLDVQRAQVNELTLVGFTPPVLLESTDMHTQIEELVTDLMKAERPAMLIGGGVRSPEAIRAFDALCEALGMPAFPTWNALDVVSSDHTFYGGRVGTYGGSGRNFAIQSCDLLLCIGTRLSGRITGGNVASFARGAKRYVVDVDAALLTPQNQQLPFHVSINSDAAAFMRSLEYSVRLRRVDGVALPSWHDWSKRVGMLRDKYNPLDIIDDHPTELGGHEWAPHPYVFAHMLGRALPENAIIVYDCGGNAVVMNHAFATKRGQRYFSNNGNSPMGFSFCAALGAWFADPSRPVVCIIGDGGMNMNIQELQTMRTYGCNVKVFILNNGIYGITQAFQDTHFGGRYEASGGKTPGDYVAPNFCAIARAYDIDAMRVKQERELQKAIEVAMQFDRPMIVDVRSPGFKTYEPKINGWATPIEDMYPWLDRHEFRAMMEIDPLPGWHTKEYGPYETPGAKS